MRDSNPTNSGQVLTIKINYIQMKNILAVMILLLTTTLCNGQYKSVFGEDLTEWYISYTSFGHGPGFCEVAVITIEEDVEIDGLVYKKVSGINMYFREDTILGKVWRRWWGGETEHLIMDLSLSVGDTIFLNDNSDFHVVHCSMAIADSIYYDENGKNIITNCLAFSCAMNTMTSGDGNVPLKFIEGVGPNVGFYYGGHWHGEGSLLLCTFKDGVQEYHNTEFDSPCDTVFYDYTQIEKNENNTNIEIFPNPITNNIFTVEFESPFTGKLILINGLGNTVLNRKVNSNTTNITVNLPNFPAGLYYLMVTDYLGNISTAKIIIN